jgi:hypothetical protein
LINLYLDIDGVLVGKPEPKSSAVGLALHAEEFLFFALEHFDCRWLTTHCTGGDIAPVIDYLREFTSVRMLELASKVKPCAWHTLKTEAIDFTSDFYWLDDSLLMSEIAVLKQKKALDRWIQVDTRHDPDGLAKAMSLLKERLK